jgi:Sigma-70, region 4
LILSKINGTLAEVRKVASDLAMGLSETDKREFCTAHGWVGRRVFQRDRHDLCEDPAEDLTDVEEVSSDVEEAGEEVLLAEDAEVDDEIETVASEAEAPRWSRAAARRQGIPPKKTLAVRRITQVELAAGRAELRALGADEPYERPRTRGDCARVPRPCPYVACKYSLFLDVSETGSIILNFPHLEPGEMPPDQSCALDLADRGPMTLEDIAVVTNLTRERIRQVELKALIKRARPAAVARGLGPEDAAAAGSRYQVGPGGDLAETGVEGAVPSDVATILSGGGGSDDS